MRHAKILLKIALVLAIAVPLLFLALLKYSTSPSFCNSCHIMKPYYEAWKTSKHNKVSCVECHYPPEGPKHLAWKKFQALSQVVKYVTRTYSSKPYAEIEDTSCLRFGCHSERLLKGKVTFSKGIIFDHKPHLEEERRGRQLRCVSCHSQIVVGKHVEVTVDTCYLCHFKGSAERSGASPSGMKTARWALPFGTCLSCHEVPSGFFVMGGVKYNHKDFVEKHKAECQSCHLDVVEGDGDAPKERCFTCHNQPEKLEKYEDIDFMHENHITKHNVACFHCHKEIRHKITREKISLEGNCSMCHSNEHTAQKNMYMGLTGKGVENMPSPMYLAEVDCIACHIAEEEPAETVGFKGQTYKASEAGCVKCHGEQYKGLLDAWKNELNSAIALVEGQLAAAGKADDAQYNLNFVKYGKGVHNIYYAASLLRKASADLGVAPSSTPNMILDGSYCTKLCHAKLGVKVPEKVKFRGKDMPHAMHATTLDLNCDFCHDIGAHGAHKELKFKENFKDCESCHAI